MKKDANGNNCDVIGTKAEEATHVSTATPFATKKKEIMADPMYRTDLNKGFNTARQKATTKARRDGAVRPLDGGAAKKL
jgi:hypothetical protein